MLKRFVIREEWARRDNYYGTRDPIKASINPFPSPRSSPLSWMKSIRGNRKSVTRLLIIEPKLFVLIEFNNEGQGDFQELFTPQTCPGHSPEGKVGKNNGKLFAFHFDWEYEWNKFDKRTLWIIKILVSASRLPLSESTWMARIEGEEKKVNYETLRL